MTPDVEYIENFVVNAAELFWTLRTVDWDELMLSRQTSSFGIAYNYGQMKYPPRPMHPALVPVCNQIKERFGFRPNNALLNHYPDGQSSMGAHSDDESRLVRKTGVAILSLGAPRTLSFVEKQERVLTHRIVLEPASLVYLRPGSQKEWAHSIEPEEEADARISVSFRLLDLED